MPNGPSDDSKIPNRPFETTLTELQAEKQRSEEGVALKKRKMHENDLATKGMTSQKQINNYLIEQLGDDIPNIGLSQEMLRQRGVIIVTDKDLPPSNKLSEGDKRTFKTGMDLINGQTNDFPRKSESKEHDVPKNIKDRTQFFDEAVKQLTKTNHGLTTHRARNKHNFRRFNKGDPTETMHVDGKGGVGDGKRTTEIFSPTAYTEPSKLAEPTLVLDPSLLTPEMKANLLMANSTSGKNGEEGELKRGEPMQSLVHLLTGLATDPKSMPLILGSNPHKFPLPDERQTVDDNYLTGNRTINSLPHSSPEPKGEARFVGVSRASLETLPNTTLPNLQPNLNSFKNDRTSQSYVGRLKESRNNPETGPQR